MLTRIYKITNTINGDIYVGSTTCSLRERLQKHKERSREKPMQNNLYKFVSQNGWDCCEIILLEEFISANKKEQTKKEQEYIDQLNPSMNRRNAFDKNCMHGIKTSKCKVCGNLLCVHRTPKCFCKICGGKSICHHNKIKFECVDCGGKQVCPHKKVKAKCKECGGSSICTHNKQRSYCIECKGNQICSHKRSKSKCVDCGGKQVCPHKKVKYFCIECTDFICDICDMKLASKSSLNSHIFGHLKNMFQAME